jgi:hypothetical protein
MIYQHEALGADKTITNAIDTHVQAEQTRQDDDEDGSAGCASPRRLMARTVRDAPGPARSDLEDKPLTCIFNRGASDGNRTRTISLGICAIRAVTWPDLQGGLSASDRERPVFTGVNGMLMAR